MYYSAIGLLAALILIIENQDILKNAKGSFEKPAWKVYRRFLYAVLVYYITDILWGILESRKLPTAISRPSCPRIPKSRRPSRWPSTRPMRLAPTS